MLKKSGFPAAIMLLLLLPLASPPLLAATIKVSTTADDTFGNGNCTLREAVIAANTDSAVDQCTAGSGADTIIVPAGTYVLTLTGPGDDAGLTGDLDVLGEVTIRGAGAGVTIIDGGFGFDGQVPWDPSGDRVLHVLAGGNLVLSRVTVRGGLCGNGAGIFNAGRLLVQDSNLQDNLVNEDSDYCTDPTPPCAFSVCTAGGAGLYNRGDVTLSRSTVSGNLVLSEASFDPGFPGGGLLNQGWARIALSEFSGNYSAAGGGIMNYGDLEVTETWIRSNGARFYGGGLTNRSIANLFGTTVEGNWDGGILNEGDRLTLRNSTVSGNHSSRIGGSVADLAGTAEITSSTIADNTSSSDTAVAGILGRTRLMNTIVSNPGFGDCWDPGVSLGNNLDGDGSCGLTASGDLPDTDPRLGLLADNGGPTPTHALLPGSPAIDHIPTDQCGVAADQRGVLRPQPRLKVSNCDIGAYEFSPAGDIRLLIEDVMSLGARKVLSQVQVSTLAGWLKLAAGDAVAGHPEFACARLDDFTTTVLRYVGEGSLDPVLAEGLLDDAARIRFLLCS